MWPRDTAQAVAMVTKTVLRLSQPWSNSSPSGLCEPVRRACLPSMASSVWYANRPRAQANVGHAGACAR